MSNHDPHYRIAIQGPDNKGSILRLVSSIVSCSRPTAFFGAFAYATKKGVNLLRETLELTSPDWESAGKQWIVSFDYGHTEPEAIRELQGIPNSQVRVPYASEVLRRRLRPKHTFHGKTLVIHQGNQFSEGKGGVMVASANMTLNGLCFGHEHASAYTWSRPQELPINTWNEMEIAYTQLSKLFELSEQPTPELLNSYAERRPKRVRTKNEDTTDEIDKVSAQDAELSLFENASLATARNFWVDVDYVVENRGRGNPGNQIDLQHGSRVFFGFPSLKVPKNTVLGEVVIKYRQQSTPCHIRFGNNQMDKLNLPIPGSGGPPEYSGKTLLFSRSEGGAFDLSVRSRNSASRWKSKSRNQSNLFKMRSGRQYGVFS